MSEGVEQAEAAAPEADEAFVSTPVERVPPPEPVGPEAVPLAEAEEALAEDEAEAATDVESEADAEPEAPAERAPPPVPVAAAAVKVAARAGNEQEHESSGEAESDESAPKKKRRSKKKAEPEPSGLPKNLEAMEWYVLKVQSNREDSVAANIQRRLKMAALDHYVDTVVVPTEKLLEIKDGKKKVVKRKYFPGYVYLHMEMQGEAWSVIRDTPGVGHFLGAENKPAAMTESDRDRFLARTVATNVEGETAAKEAAPKPAIDFAPGDRVVIKEGPFENFEGDIDEVNEAKGTVRVVVQIFGRPNPVEIEYWQVGKVRT